MNVTAFVKINIKEMGNTDSGREFGFDYFSINFISGDYFRIKNLKMLRALTRVARSGRVIQPGREYYFYS